MTALNIARELAMGFMGFPSIHRDDARLQA
jgi:hypothetical protein